MATTGRGSPHGAAGHLHTHAYVPHCRPPPGARVEVERTPDHMQDGAGTRAGMDERREGAMFHPARPPFTDAYLPKPPLARLTIPSTPSSPSSALRPIERRADPICRFP